MPNHHQQAIQLLHKADQDLLAFAKFRADPDMAVEILGFHAQQAAEKMLKAVLAERQVRFPYTHYLVDLMALLKTHDIPFPEALEAMRDLSAFGVEFRYEDLIEETEPFNAEATLMLLAQLRQWAAAIIQP